MPFQPPQQTNPLEQLMQLYQLQQGMAARKRQEQDDALTRAMQFATRGVDPSGFLSGVDPSQAEAVSQLYRKAQSDSQQAALVDALNPAAVAPYAQSLAPPIIPTGTIGSVDPAQFDQRLQMVTDTLRARGVPEAQIPLVVENIKASADAVRQQRESRVGMEAYQTRNALDLQEHSAKLARETAVLKEQAKQQAATQKDLADGFAARLATGNPEEQAAVESDEKPFV